MIREIGCYEFPGFYESLFCNSDEFIDFEAEDEKYIKEQTNKEVEVVYEYENEDFSKYKANVCNTFMDYYIEKIIEVLPYEITENENFEFERVDDSIDVVSPKYYNYSTDRCYCNIETNKQTKKKKKKHTLSLIGAEKYIIKHFTSRDGFISFISNDIKYWKSLKIEEYEENHLIALLDMLISLSDEDAFEDITLSTYYDIEKTNYVTVIVYYKEDEFDYYDFIEKFKTE